MRRLRPRRTEVTYLNSSGGEQSWDSNLWFAHLPPYKVAAQEMSWLISPPASIVHIVKSSMQVGATEAQCQHQCYVADRGKGKSVCIPLAVPTRTRSPVAMLLREEQLGN